MERNQSGSGSDARGPELEKSRSHIVMEIIAYVPHSILRRTILKKITGHITLFSFDSGEQLTEKALPFDTFIQVIDGNADLTINQQEYKLLLGEGIIIPAHTNYRFNASEPFKMMVTVIKSGYES